MEGERAEWRWSFLFLEKNMLTLFRITIKINIFCPYQKYRSKCTHGYWRVKITPTLWLIFSWSIDLIEKGHKICFYLPMFTKSRCHNVVPVFFIVNYTFNGIPMFDWYIKLAWRSEISEIIFNIRNKQPGSFYRNDLYFYIFCGFYFLSFYFYNLKYTKIHVLQFTTPRIIAKVYPKQKNIHLRGSQLKWQTLWIVNHFAVVNFFTNNLYQYIDFTISNSRIPRNTQAIGP